MTTSPFLLFANNAGSTLAGSISNTAVSVNLQAGGGALFPNPTGNQYFVATLIDAATGLLREIVWVTSRTTDTLTIVRAREGTTPLAWNAGDLFQELWTAGQAGAMLQANQFVVPATNFFVDNSIGSNSFTGLSPTVTGTNGPWATLPFSITSLIPYNFGGQTVTIQLANTGISYGGPGLFASPANGILSIVGNTASQGSYVISGTGTSTQAVFGVSSGTVSLQGLTLENTGALNHLCEAGTSGTISTTNVTFTTGGTASSFGLLVASNAGNVVIASGCIFASGAAIGAALIQASGGSMAQEAVATAESMTVTQGFCVAFGCGQFALGSGSWVGSSVVGPRYDAFLNGVINTGGGGANFFPGSTAGTPTPGTQGPTGGVYA